MNTDDTNRGIDDAPLHFAQVEDQEPVVVGATRGASGVGRTRAGDGEIPAVAVVADVESMHTTGRGHVLGEHLRLGRVGDVDRVDVAVAEIGAVVSQAVRREVSFMAGYRRDESAAAI